MSYIHVAGTNGKGSVATKIAKALEFSGYRVGLYTSPHLFCFRERIQIQGEKIPEEAVERGVQKWRPFLKDAPLFDLTTKLAFDYFCEQAVDVAVIETGIGGRLDATNVITPILSIITSIGWDHMKHLGNTLEAIAFEKAGIIKPGVPVVVGSKAQYASIRRTAQEKGSPLFVAPETQGFYDDENRATASCALSILEEHFNISEEAKEAGLKIRPPCRFEECQGAILDVAHNPDGFQRLFEGLRIHFPNRSLRLVLGLSEDKDVEGCLKLVADHAAHVHLVQAESKRTATTELLARTLQRLNFTAFSQEVSVAEGIKKAAPEKELLVVCGSFYIMQEAKVALGLHCNLM
jgi:dihydrofolate synthase/folylpolyglutamate synthase